MAVNEWLGSDAVTMAGTSPVMLAALRRMRPCLLAFFTAEMLGRNLVGLLADLDIVLVIVLDIKGASRLGDLESSLSASSGTLCNHCRAKSTGLASRGRALSVDAVLSMIRVLASWSLLLVDASASLRFGLTAAGSSIAALGCTLAMLLSANPQGSVLKLYLQPVVERGGRTPGRGGLGQESDKTCQASAYLKKAAVVIVSRLCSVHVVCIHVTWHGNSLTAGRVVEQARMQLPLLLVCLLDVL